jgi:4-carboxymuconolactone decarboxylase
MARIPPVTRERVRADLRSIFDEVSSGPGGVGTGPMSVLKYNPEMSRRAIPLFNYVRNESSLPQKVRELAMLTTARAKDCPYIWNAHVRLGRQAGLSDALINALRDREPLPPMSVERTRNELSVTVLSRVTRHASIVQWARISVCARRGECAPGGHGTASSHGDHCRSSS